MTRPFEGIRIIDVTHVLAGPFAACQLAVLGAEVIKVEHSDEPDQTRDSGSDRELNRRGMGTSYLTQSSNKRSIRKRHDGFVDTRNCPPANLTTNFSTSSPSGS